MTIYCKNAEEFFEAISECVRRGLTFDANYGACKIELTGGY